MLYGLDLNPKAPILSGTRTVDLDVVAGRNDVGGRLDCLAVGKEWQGVEGTLKYPVVSSQLISMSAAVDSSQQYLSVVASFCCFLDRPDVLVDWRIGLRIGLYLLVGGSLSSAAVDKHGTSVAAVAVSLLVVLQQLWKEPGHLLLLLLFLLLCFPLL